MRIREFVKALIVSASVMSACFQSVAASAANEIEDLVNRYRQETKCGAVSVVVYENGEASCYGDADSLYQIGSMTKAFTGLAVQKLIAEGLVNEDGNISDYVPGFEARYGSENVDITVRELLEQKSGYTNNEKDYPSATAEMSLSEWARSISGRELKSRPGEEYAYSNVNYNLLGLIAENASGMPYRDYMEQEVLAPLGLEHTFVGMPADGKVAEGTRLGYRRAADFPLAVREASIPAGYFYSNAADMGRWIGIWTGSIDVPEELAGALAKVKGSLKEEGDYYSGWELFADGVTGHSGGTPNYSSRVVFSEEKQLGVCVLSNLNVAATTDSLCNSIYAIASGGEAAGLSTDIWTLFDRIFTAVTAAGVLVLLAVVVIRNRVLLVVLDAVMALLLTLVFILFPMIFGAGMKEILFTWAPWSLSGGLLAIAGVIAVTTGKLLLVNKHADHNETGKRQSADGHDRVPGIQ
ncbi:MAG: beta-lactamase family protein [Lachnospiraceae bacterium]|nr:beta-lactamase family protein [Lachnospiraceae bacterium]